MMKKENQTNTRFLYWITFVAVNGGLLFGLNMAGISGAIPFIQNQFALNDVALGLAVSSIMLGCLLGAWFVGGLSDKYGRKKMLSVSAILFIVSALGCALANSLPIFVVARLLAGIAVGAVSVLGPTYISEVAPASRRGTLVSYNQFAIVIGILLAYIIDYALLSSSIGWRLMMIVPFVFGLIFLVLLYVRFPESPRWLLKAGKKEQAIDIMCKIGGTDYAVEEMKNMEISLHNDKDKSQKVSISQLFKGKTGNVVLLGTLLATFQQITGINAVVNYAPSILQQTGVGGDTAMFQSILVGLVNFLFTLVAIWLVDRVGRKVLLLWGTAGMTLSLAYMVYSFTQGSGGGIGVLISLLGYIAFFAASLAPVMWVVTSEMYPNRIRGVAMSFSTAMSWFFAVLTVQFFPLAINKLGGALTFGAFAIFSILAFLFILKYIPETKGKTLEQIEKDLEIL